MKRRIPRKLKKQLKKKLLLKTNYGKPVIAVDEKKEIVFFVKESYVVLHRGKNLWDCEIVRWSPHA